MKYECGRLKRGRCMSENKIGRGQQREVIGPDIIYWHSDKYTIANLRR